MGEVLLITGNEAIGHAALYSGCRVYCGYPITPSSEIMEFMARELPRRGGSFLQMEDEIASMAALVGASWAGAKAMTATSGPGFSLMQENLGLALMLELPCVVVNIQRVGPSSGMPTLGSQQDTLQALFGRHGDQTIIVIAPSSLQEMYDLTVRAFNLAERYRVPVVLLADGFLAHLRGEVLLRRDIPLEERRPLSPGDYATPFRGGPDLVPGFAPLGRGAGVLYTSLTHDERGYPTEDVEKNEALLRRLRDKVMRNAPHILDYEAVGLEDARVVLVAYGGAAPAARWAQRELRRRGCPAACFIPKTLSPFPEEALAQALEGRPAVVAEMSLGQLSFLVRQVVGRGHPLREVQRIGTPLDPRRLVEVALDLAGEVVRP